MYRSSLSDDYEVQANQLAADILMPVALVDKALTAVHRIPQPTSPRIAVYEGRQQSASLASSITRLIMLLAS
jgi:hypothetical protein